LARFGLAYRRITGVIFCRRASRRRSSPRRASRHRPANLQMVKAVETRWDIHEKVVIVDDEITWFGSLNPLSRQPHRRDDGAPCGQGYGLTVVSVRGKKYQSRQG
jgi:hypothetical protein